MTSPLDRWRDAPEPIDPAQARAAALVRAVPAPAELSAAQLARIEDRVLAHIRRGKTAWPSWLKWALGAAAAGGAPLAFAAVFRLAFAPVATPQPGQARVAPESVRATVAPASPELREQPKLVAARPEQPVPGSAAEAPLGLDLTGPAEPPRPRLAPAPRRNEAPAAAAAPIPSGSSLKDESALLSTALSKLRSEQNPAGALESLDEYRQRFPSGVLRDEARVARVDALLALGRRPDALGELTAIGADDLGAMPRGLELRALEAELEAEAGHCERAVPLFDALLARPASAVEERALYGRGACRAKLGEPDGAAADLRRCLERFPSGKFARAAKRLLEETGAD
jgi:hypothetical protein